MSILRERIIKTLVKRRDTVLNGGVNCIPLPFTRFRKDWPGIEQGMYYLITAGTKGGKSQLTNYIFIINTILWTYTHPGIIKPKIFYFPLEETPESITLRFMAFLLNYLTKGSIFISPTDLKSTDERKPLPEDVLEVMNSKKFCDIMDYYESVVTFYDDRNCTGVYKVMNNYAKTNGTIHYKTIMVKEVDELGITKEVERQMFDYYVPNDPNEYVIFIVDHVSLLTQERGMDLRESICKLSEYCVILRNRYNYIPAVVQQQSTETTNLEAFRSNKIRPTVAGLADGKYTARDCNMMIGLTNPHSFELPDYLGYDIKELKGHIRFLEIVLNRNGSANGICPLIFHGDINSFKEAPLPTDRTAMARIIESVKGLKDNKKFTNINNLATALFNCTYNLITK